MDNPLLLESADGREISPATQPGVQGTRVRQSFVFPPEESICGLGQHQQGIWNYRGHAVRLLQRNMEVGIPVILSSKGYSLLWDNPAVTEISVGAPLVSSTTRPARDREPGGAGENVVRWSSEVGKAIDYYFIYGPSGEKCIGNYRALTGAAPLMSNGSWVSGNARSAIARRRKCWRSAKNIVILKCRSTGLFRTGAIGLTIAGFASV